MHPPSTYIDHFLITRSRTANPVNYPWLTTPATTAMCGTITVTASARIGRYTSLVGRDDVVAKLHGRCWLDGLSALVSTACSGDLAHLPRTGISSPGRVNQRFALASFPNTQRDLKQVTCHRSSFTVFIQLALSIGVLNPHRVKDLREGCDCFIYSSADFSTRSPLFLLNNWHPRWAESIDDGA